MTMLERAAAPTSAESSRLATTAVEPLDDAIVLPPAAPYAEDLAVPERVITAPVAGLFIGVPARDVTCEGEVVQTGQVVGYITGGGVRVTVQSPFSGFFMGRLAHDGERVRPGQPLAWVRVIST